MSSLFNSTVNQANVTGQAFAEAGANAQMIGQPGGCRTLLTNFFKRFKSTASRPLPSGFPVGAAFGSVELLQWFQGRSYRNWHRIPDYLRWMQESNEDFQNDAEYKGKSQAIVARFLDAIMCLTSTQSSPMGLSNFTGDNASPPVKGVVIDHNGQTLTDSTGKKSIITFTSTSGTFFCTPFVETIPQTTNQAVCFPVLILPETPDNDDSKGKKFLYFTFQFNVSIFVNNPGPSASVYMLRVQEYHNLVAVIDQFRRDRSIVDADKDRISKGILDMLSSAISGTTVSQFEQSYQSTILAYLSSKLCPVQVPATGTPSRAVFDGPGNEPLDISFSGPSSTIDSIFFDLAHISGQTPTFQWTERPEIKGYGLQIQVQKAYFGYDASFTRTDQADTTVAAASKPALATPVTWRTAHSLNQDLAYIVQEGANSAATPYAKPTVFASITDNIVFTVDESGPTAVLQVLDRQITLTPTETSAPIVYPIFLKRSLQNAFASKQLVFDQSKGVQGNVTLANLSVFSGMTLPMIQALAVTLVDDICHKSIPVSGSTPETQGDFSYFSALFPKSSVDDEIAYYSSIHDILTYFMNAQSPYLQVSLSSSSIGLSTNQSFSIINPTGAVKEGTVAGTKFRDPTKRIPGSDATEGTIEQFKSGINITLGLTQGTDMKMLLNSFTASAGAGNVGAAAIAPVSASETYQNGNYTGSQVTSTSYMVSRLRTGAAQQNANSNSNASGNSNANVRANAVGNSRAIAIANSNSRANANANSNANKAMVRGLVAKSINSK